jgi:membrane fusion protein (multidrug efflux system)
VAVLDTGNKVTIQPVTVGPQVDRRWVIASGLRPGDRVVAEGVQKVRTGVRVNPKPFTAEATNR